MLDDEIHPDLPPPPARGPRHVQGDIRLPDNVREEMAPGRKGHNLNWRMLQLTTIVIQANGRIQEISLRPNLWKHNLLQTCRRRERQFHKIGGGVHDIYQSGARPSGEVHQDHQETGASSSSIQPLASLPATPFQREFTPEEGDDSGGTCR